MAETAVGFLVENLSELIIREANLLIGVKKTVEWIETEFRVMVVFLQSMDALDQLPQNATDCIGETRRVIRRAEDLIDTYAKRSRQLQRAAFYQRAFYWIKQRNLALGLESIKYQIVQVRQRWRIHLNAADSLEPALPAASSSQAMAKLDSAFRVLERISEQSQMGECVKWVRDELAPLHDFLQKIDSDQIRERLGERQKIWIQELRDIFQFIDGSFPDEIRVSKWQSILLRCGISNLSLDVSQIQDKILQLYRRYYAYGLGEILVDNGSRSIFPRIGMTTPIPYIERSATSSIPARQKHWRMTYSSWLTPGGSIELFRMDLKLMKALLEDTRSMGDLDERVKVWLGQIQEISVDLEALDAAHAGQGTRGVFRLLFGGRKLDRKLRQIGFAIRDVAARKMTYGVGGALGEAGLIDSIAANLIEVEHRKLLLLSASLIEILALLKEKFIPKAKLTREVESVRQELQLMQALFEDVNRKEKLDARLKVWVEEMLVLARQATAAVNVDYKSYHQRNKVARRINQVKNHIRIMSIWKHTYDIGDFKSRCTGFFNHNLKEAIPYPSEDIEEEEFDLLRREIKLMEALYDDLKKIDELDGITEAWVNEMHDLAGDATALISSSCNRFAGILIPASYIKFERNRDQLNDKIRQLSEIRLAYGIELRKRLPPHTVHEIKMKLLANHENSCIIPIVGMKNADKEALQVLINSDNAIARHFDYHTWVYVPEDSSGTSILEYLAKPIMEQQNSESLDVESTSHTEAPTEQELMQMLQEIFMHKRYLIVLDEIQTIAVWQYCLARAFQRVSTGSRIILITNEDTCSSLNSSSNAIVKLRELPSESRNVLPSYLRQCLFYFLLFPADVEVPTRRLIVLWVAEGLVRAGRDDESAEHVAERYLTELIEREIVCVKKKKLNGKVKACKLSDATRDGLMNAAKEARFFRDTSEMISRLVDHHGTSDSCFIEINGNPNSSTSVPNYKNVLSFLSFDTQEGSMPGEEIGNFLHKCISAGCFLELRVLDLEKVFRPKLPNALSKLTLLRYLGLRWTYLEILPEYVKELLNLQVLDVKHTYISILPKSIWRMQYLRHLYLSETYRTRFAGRPTSVSLTELQTLWGAFIDENTMVEGGLDTVLSIRKLGLSCQSRSSQLPLMQQQLVAVARWISILNFLEILRLKSRDEHGKASQLPLETFVSNQKLSTVYLLGKLRPSVVPTFPVNLIEITLSGSELPEDPMISLEKLPKLLILRLLSQSVMCQTMHCSTGGFPMLKLLKIWKLDNLKNWEVEEGALPSLEDLEIRSCNNLEVLPDALRHVSTLEKLRLTRMPPSFIGETEVTQPELWAKLVPQLD